MRRTHRLTAALAAVTTAASMAATSAGASSPSPLAQPVGTVVSSAPLKHSLWVPGTTAQAFKLTYVTTDALGHKALSTGEVMLPKGKAPAGGWPLISWAHGTSGLADACAPSNMGPAEPARDFGYLGNWMKQGYAIVASDYAGLGTPGLPAYLNGESEAHNVVDMVKAGRSFAADQLPADQQLSSRWVVIGQSQGGGAAIYTARYATEYGGSDLHYLGAVGTGVPAYIEVYVSLLGPKVPPVPLPAGLTVYMLYILDSLRWSRPQLGLDTVLTAEGKKYLAMSERYCAFDLETKVANVALGDLLTQPLVTLPHWQSVVDGYMKMPESGFDRPFFMAHGAVDTDVPFPATAAYAAKLKANGQPLSFHVYPTDHSGALIRSQKDSTPFVRALFANGS